MNNFKIVQSITDRRDASLGLYFKDVSKQPMLTPEEEIKLTNEIKNGDSEAINKLVKANLRFVISVAKQYQNKGIPLVDLIQEGNLGMLQAAKLFNPDKGFRFISYAVWWIRQAIMKAISDQCRTVRVPMSQLNRINKIRKETEKFEQLNGRKPSINELAEVTNISPDKIGPTLISSNKSISLDNPIKDDEAGCLSDLISDDTIAPTDNYASRNDLSDEIRRILSKLSYRDRDIIRMSFGIGMQPMSNEEIGKRFGIGSERVRQIQHSTINFIRKNHLNRLKELL